MGRLARVPQIPNCDIHFYERNGTVVPARYDGKTKKGPWANMCESCFTTHGIGLGTGRGQLLVTSIESEDAAVSAETTEVTTDTTSADLIEVIMPFSEVCMHMKIAGKPMLVEELPGGMAQLYSLDGRKFSFPITRGEAGLPRTNPEESA